MKKRSISFAAKLAAVVAVCLIIRGVSDMLSGNIPECLTRAAMAAVKLEIPGAHLDMPSLAQLALMAEIPGAAETYFSKYSPVKVPDDPEPPADNTDDNTSAEPTPPPEDADPPDDTGTENDTSEPDDPQIPDDAPPENTKPLAEPEDTVGTTITGEKGNYTPASEGIYLHNKTDYDIDVDALLAQPLEFSSENATVLIIHTHGSEAYNPDGDDRYVPSDPSRTEDKNYNVVRVGDELESVLTARGVKVIHDRELYDYPSYNGSYTRSMESIKRHLAEDDSIRVVIDLHRDALIAENGTVYKTVADIGDTPSAQVMLIAGTNFSGLDHPNWKKNLSFALKIQAQMVESYPTLARPLTVTQYRYNQHATTGSLIAEVGCNGNTLQEALTAVRYFGECLADVLEPAG